MADEHAAARRPTTMSRRRRRSSVLWAICGHCHAAYGPVEHAGAELDHASRHRTAPPVRRDDTRDRNRALAAPALLLVGQDDPLVGLAFAHRLHLTDAACPAPRAGPARPAARQTATNEIEDREREQAARPLVATPSRSSRCTLMASHQHDGAGPMATTAVDQRRQSRAATATRAEPATSSDGIDQDLAARFRLARDHRQHRHAGARVIVGAMQSRAPRNGAASRRR